MSAVDFHNGLEKIETGFNILAAIPGVGLYTSPWRQTAGKVEAGFGVLLFVFGGLSYGINHLIRNDTQVELKSKKIIKEGAELVVQGALNVLRGKAEGVGSVFLGGPNAFFLLGSWPLSSYFGAPLMRYGSIFG